MKNNNNQQKKMIDYSKGKIYKIVSSQTEKIYIGSTVKHKLCDRMSLHRNEYKKYKEGTKNKYISSFDILKYADAKIVLIESFPCTCKEELNAREQYYLDANKEHIVNWKNAYGIDWKRRKERPKTKHECGCGMQYTQGHKKRHFKTKKHLAWEEQNKI